MPECYICSESVEEVHSVNCELYNPSARVCSSCLEDCPTCEECNTSTIPQYTHTSLSDERTLCSECYWEETVSCEECTTHILSDNSCYHEDTDRSLCEDCYGEARHNEEREDERAECDSPEDYDWSAILDYHHPITWTKRGDTRLSPLMGVELEIGYRINPSERVLSTLEKYLQGIAVAMYDGSINNGCEIITEPMTVEKHKEINYRELFEKLRKMKCRSHNGGDCGLHIHLSRDAIKKRHLRKLRTFLAVNKAPIFKLSRRNDSRYAYPPHTELSWLPHNFWYNARYGSSEKYSWLNESPRHTIEFRMFRGTLDHLSFKACLQFVALLPSFLSTHGATHCMSVASWNSFVLHSLKYTKDFKEYLVRRDIPLSYEDPEKDIPLSKRIEERLLKCRRGELNHLRLGELAAIGTNSRKLAEYLIYYESSRKDSLRAGDYANAKSYDQLIEHLIWVAKLEEEFPSERQEVVPATTSTTTHFADSVVLPF